MDILQQMLAGTSGGIPVDIPKSNVKMHLRVLTDFEEQQAEFAAEAVFVDAKIPIGMHNFDLLQLERTTQKIFLALTDDEGNRVAESAQKFKQSLTRIFQNMLVEKYNDLEEKCNPNPEKMTDSAYEEIVSAVKKKPDATVLNISSLTTLRRLIITLVNQLSNLQMDSGTPSAQ